MSRDHGVEQDEELLRALGARGRAEREHLSELERLATPATRDGGDSGATEAFAPFGPAIRARFVDEIARTVGRSPDGVRMADAGTAKVSALAAHPRFAGRRRAMVLTAAATFAAAAAFLLVVRWPAAPAVTYALELRGGDERQRAAGEGEAATEMPVLTATSWLEVRARPARPEHGVGAWLFARTEGAGSAGERLAAVPEISADGVVRWRGTAAALLGDRRGTIELRVVVGRGAPPAAGDVFAAGGAPPRQQSWLAGRVQVRP